MVNISMQIVDSQIISGKKVLLRLDLDVPVANRQVLEDFRLRAGIPALKLCIENASKVTIIGHLGRPAGKDLTFSLKPVFEWFRENGFPQMTFDEDSNLQMFENLRFDPREESQDESFARELAQRADIYIFEAFASHRPAVSTTLLPKIMPHAAGLQFAKEVEKLIEVRDNPKKPLIAIMGGAKVEDKLPVIEVLAKKADAVLVGGKLVKEIQSSKFKVQSNVLIGKLTDDGLDIAPETTESWKKLIEKAAQVVWNGPVGKVQSSKFKIQNLGSERGSYDLAKFILESKAETIIGGGDTIAFLNRIGLLEEFKNKGFVSTGGGAMLKFLSDGALPTINTLV